MAFFNASGGLFSVALSLGLPPAGVTRRRVSVEPGLSSLAPFRALRERPPNHLARAALNALAGAASSPLEAAHHSVNQSQGFDVDDSVGV